MDEEDILSPVHLINEEQSEEEKTLVSSKKEKTSLLAIAFYNAGSQLEFLKRYRQCIDSFTRAIRILERNFAPNYPLTIEFNKTLSKALEKYKKHLDWKGTHKTFSNLQEGFVSKRMCQTQNRPMSALTTKNRTQPMQGRFKKITRNRRPITAKTREVRGKAMLNNS